MWIGNRLKLQKPQNAIPPKVRPPRLRESLIKYLGEVWWEREQWPVVEHLTIKSQEKIVESLWDSEKIDHLNY